VDAEADARFDGADSCFDGPDLCLDRARCSDGGAEISFESALRLAFRYLNRRDRTVGEMEHHLANNNVEPGVADRALRTLCQQGYLDDARYARLFIEDRRELDQWGNERIRRALRERGIDTELIDSAITEESADSELARALLLLRRRFPSPLRTTRDRQRAMGMMMRRGFDSELALQALTRRAREGDG
jgi:regulatory protein